MIIKHADDKSPQIATLEALYARRDASDSVRQRIEREIQNIRAGIQGEKEAAYEIDFQLGDSKNYAVIHDLRIECNGRVAQIDHLVFNRLLDMWVCETKHFCEGLAINEHGEYSRFYNNKPYGMASPHEQNLKHMKVLESMFQTGVVQLPKRMGFVIKPNMYGMILVSSRARISRPKTKIPGVDTIVKIDQFWSMVEKTNRANINPLLVAKVIGVDTLRDLACAIAAEHKPVEFNWAAKFGLAGVEAEETIVREEPMWEAPSILPEASPLKVAKATEEPAKRPKKKLICATCSAPVELKVARFCWFNKPRFGDNIYCMECQKAF